MAKINYLRSVTSPDVWGNWRPGNRLVLLSDASPLIQNELLTHEGTAKRLWGHRQ